VDQLILPNGSQKFNSAAREPDGRRTARSNIPDNLVQVPECSSRAKIM